MNVILTGMPASGKTTVSKLLSEKLNLKLVDTDEEIVKKYGAICDIFATLGEPAFRNMETEVVRNVCAQSGLVVSTGGGCVLRAENVELFKNSGKIVYLLADLQTLTERVKNDNTRPLISGDSAVKLEKLLKERSPIYEACADFTVDTNGKSPKEIVENICKLLGYNL